MAAGKRRARWASEQHAKKEKRLAGASEPDRDTSAPQQVTVQPNIAVDGAWVTGEREWSWWAHTRGGNALAFKQPT